MSDLISKLKAYANGTISHAEFSEWFFPFSRTSERRYTGTDLEFIDAVQGTFAEASSGGWTEEQLLQELELELAEYEGPEIRLRCLRDFNPHNTVSGIEIDSSLRQTLSSITLFGQTAWGGSREGYSAQRSMPELKCELTS